MIASHREILLINCSKRLATQIDHASTFMSLENLASAMGMIDPVKILRSNLK